MARPAPGGPTRRCRRHAGRSAAVRSGVAGPGRPGCSTTARCLRSAGQRGIVMSGGLQFERLQDQLLRLRLVQSVERLASLLEAAAKRELSYSDFQQRDRKSTRLNSSHQIISYAVFCLKKKKAKK